VKRILKKGVHFFSQDTNTPLLEAEIPSLLTNLTRYGVHRAALAGLQYMRFQGMTINKILDILGDSKEKNS
jgi:hypothetical protein